MAGWTNKLYFGDNLNISLENMRSEWVDLTYLDDIPAGRDADTPRWGLDTFKKVQKALGNAPGQGSLLDG